MRLNLDEVEIRVLGSLMEKEATTPENYPLSLNSLLSACNQKSNRDPLLTLKESDVQRGLEALGARGLARLTTTGGRVARYRHSIEKMGLSAQARAVLAELMLRGPQTPGELRNRADRMAEFADLAAVETALGELLQHGPPLVVRLPRQPGRKEQRYAQLLGGMPEIVEEEEPEQEEAVARAPRRASAPSDEKLVRLEGDVAALREEIAALRQEVEELIASFQ
jgi:uncharacterized protein